MRAILFSVPFVAFTSLVMLMFFDVIVDSRIEMVFASILVLCLLLLPVISKKSLTMGYVAIFWLIFSFGSGMLFSHQGCGGDPVHAALQFVNHSLRAPLVKYKSDHGAYPTTEQGINALIENSADNDDANWKGPYINRFPEDPWGNPYQYRSPGIRNPEKYDLWSFGPDGVESEDDIGNW